LLIDQEQANIVRRIFDIYMGGLGVFNIASQLNKENIPSLTGEKWHEGTVRGMLTNEKSKGDCILQKTFTPENRRYATGRNNGELQSYYIEENYPAIVSKAVWDSVQQVMQQQREQSGLYQTNF